MPFDTQRIAIRRNPAVTVAQARIHDHLLAPMRWREHQQIIGQLFAFERTDHLALRINRLGIEESVHLYAALLQQWRDEVRHRLNREWPIDREDIVNFSLLAQPPLTERCLQHEGIFQRRWRTSIWHAGHASDDAASGEMRHLLAKLQTGGLAVEMVGAFGESRDVLRGIARASRQHQIIVVMGLPISGDQLFFGGKNAPHASSSVAHQRDILPKQPRLWAHQFVRILSLEGHIEPTRLIGMGSGGVKHGDVRLVA